MQLEKCTHCGAMAKPYIHHDNDTWTYLCTSSKYHRFQVKRNNVEVTKTEGAKP